MLISRGNHKRGDSITKPLYDELTSIWYVKVREDCDESEIPILFWKERHSLYASMSQIGISR